MKGLRTRQAFDGVCPFGRGFPSAYTLAARPLPGHLVAQVGAAGDVAYSTGAGGSEALRGAKDQESLDEFDRRLRRK